MLVRRLAAGGMAVLYLAIHRSIAGIERLLVIKRILPEYGRDKGYVEMLLKEARIAMTFAHSNIVTVFDVGQADGEYFIAMEHIHGEDLRSVVRAMKPKGATEFPLEHALAIGIGVAAGLAYAHDKKDLQGTPLRVVHRDISPQNVVVTFTGDVKIVDFGIAKATLARVESNVAGTATRTVRPRGTDSASGEVRRDTHVSLNSLDEGTGPGKVKGKIPYMSPEQARGDDLDHRSDIFSLGIMLFELCTGRRLFRTGSDADTIKMITDGDYPRPSEVNPRITPALESVIMKALAPDRDARYQSAKEMQADLESVARADHIPVSAVGLGAWMTMLFAERLAEHDLLLAEAKTASDKLGHAADDDERQVSGTVTLPPRPAEPAAPSRTPLVAGLIVCALAAGGYYAYQSTRPVAAPVVSDGVITVRSTPEGAHIWLNDAPTSHRTPHELTGLATGAGTRYRVRLTAEGYAPYTGEVTLDRAGGRGEVSATLAREQAASFAVLEVRTTPPGARVIVDGREVPGATPVTIPELRAGVEHAVVVRSPEHLDENFSFVGVGGRVESRALTLRERPLGPDEAWITVPTEPGTASLRVNDRELTGGGPYRVRVTVGPRPITLTASAPGFDSVSRFVRPTVGQTLAVRTMHLTPHESSGSAHTPPPQPPPPPPPTTQDTRPGTIRVGATGAWCEAFVDGRSYGQTPTRDITLSPGRHAVRCVNPERGTRTQNITVAPGSRQPVRIDFSQ
jgi:serine/threonine-protein kinase